MKIQIEEKELWQLFARLIHFGEYSAILNIINIIPELNNEKYSEFIKAVVDGSNEYEKSLEFIQDKLKTL